MTTFGAQAVTIVTISEDSSQRDRYNKPLKVRTEHAVKGCRFRPLEFSEEIKFGDLALQKYKLTAPPVPAILAGDTVDEIIVDGIAYQIVGGVRVFPDMDGSLFKVTVLCERRTS